MWLKALEFLLSAGSFIYDYWQKLKQKRQIEAQLQQEEKDAQTKAIDDAKVVADNSGGDANLLVRPDERGHNQD